ELSSVGERCQQLVKQIELGGVRFERLAVAGLFGQPVMRHGEGDVAGNSLGNRKISLRKMGLLAREKMHRSPKPTAEGDGHGQNRLHPRFRSWTFRKEAMV